MLSPSCTNGRIILIYLAEAGMAIKTALNKYLVDKGV